MSPLSIGGSHRMRDRTRATVPCRYGFILLRRAYSKKSPRVGTGLPPAGFSGWSQNGCPQRLFVRDPHFLDHARVLGELFACQDTQLFGRSAAHRKAQILELVADFGIGEGVERLSIQP